MKLRVRFHKLRGGDLLYSQINYVRLTLIDGCTKLDRHFNRYFRKIIFLFSNNNFIDVCVCTLRTSMFEILYTYSTF